MKVGILSRCPEVISWAQSLGLNSTLIDNVNAYESQIQELLLNVDCLFVDVAADTEKETWISIDSIVQAYLDVSGVLKCVVSPAERIVPKKAWWDELLPRQSCVMKDGKEVTIGKRSLVCSYFCYGCTRQDNVKQYSAQAIQTDGCNGTILAWHFLAEIGHKLGYVPKYGA